jgi:hypothetical protein
VRELGIEVGSVIRIAFPPEHLRIFPKGAARAASATSPELGT